MTCVTVVTLYKRSSEIAVRSEATELDFGERFRIAENRRSQISVVRFFRFSRSGFSSERERALCFAKLTGGVLLPV